MGGSEELKILLLVPADALVVYAALRAAGRCDAFPGLRRFWLLIAFAWSVELAADLTLAVYVFAFDESPFPSLADFFFVTFYPLLLIALLRVPTAPTTRSQRLRTALDCAAVIVGGGAAVWYFVLGETIVEGGQDFLATAVSIAYPLGDVILLGALALALLRPSPAALRTPLRLIAAGLVTLRLTPLEFRLLAAFIRHPGQVLSHDQLIEMAWRDPLVQPEQVKLYVGRLRRKLGDPEAIETLRGFGYRYLPPEVG